MLIDGIQFRLWIVKNASKSDDEPLIYILTNNLNKRNITVSQNIPDELPVIAGDRTRLMQVILNILKNSIEAIDIYAAENYKEMNI